MSLQDDLYIQLETLNRRKVEFATKFGEISARLSISPENQEAQAQYRWSYPTEYLLLSHVEPNKQGKRDSMYLQKIERDSSAPVTVLSIDLNFLLDISYAKRSDFVILEENLSEDVVDFLTDEITRAISAMSGNNVSENIAFARGVLQGNQLVARV